MAATAPLARAACLAATQATLATMIRTIARRVALLIVLAGITAMRGWWVPSRPRSSYFMSSLTALPKLKGRVRFHAPLAAIDRLGACAAFAANPYRMGDIRFLGPTFNSPHQMYRNSCLSPLAAAWGAG
jgi:hypothetical protein